VQKTKAILLLSDYSKLHVFFSAIKYGEPSWQCAVDAKN
jgi:hypothetical protein